MLCTASQKFLASMSRVPGLPIVHYNSTGVLVLSPPSQATVRAKLAQEEDKRAAGAQLLDGVVDGENVRGAPSSAAASAADAAATRSRKQGPKAPNPLSMKKKKRKVAEEEAPDAGGEGAKAAGEGDEDDDAGRRKKKRKRGRGKGAVAEAISEIRAEGEEKRIRAIEERAARNAPPQDDSSDDDSD